MERLRPAAEPGLRRRCGALLGALSSAALLAACAGPRYAVEAPGSGPIAETAPGEAPPVAGRSLHGTDKPYEINGRWYYPRAEPDYDQIGLASWYGAGEHNRHTADGEVFDPFGLSAAHRTLPLPSIVEVTNLANGRRMQVRLNDRGPFVDGRLIDLSRGAAEALGFDHRGLTQVRVRYIGPAPPLAAEGVMQARQTRHGAVIAPAEPDFALAAAPPAGDTLVRASTGGVAPLDRAGFRVLLGAYASRGDASQAVAQLGADARYVIEPVDAPGGAVYRVILAGFPGEDEALAAQMRYSAAGFTGARVLRPF